MTSLRGVLFDVDGTISDSWHLGFSCTQKVLEEFGHRLITEDEYHEGTKYSTPRRFAWHLTNNPDDEIGVVLGNRFDEMYVTLVTPHTTALYPGICDIFQNLRNQNSVKIGALSNACGAYVKAVIDVNKLSPYFDIALGADEVPHPKPKPDGLWHLCKELNLDPKQSIYIGDSPSDGAAAYAAGMKSIGVTWGSHPKSTVSTAFTYTADTMSDLEQYINKFLSE